MNTTKKGYLTKEGGKYKVTSLSFWLLASWFFLKKFFNFFFFKISFFFFFFLQCLMSLSLSSLSLCLVLCRPGSVVGLCFKNRRSHSLSHTSRTSRSTFHLTLTDLTDPPIPSLLFFSYCDYLPLLGSLLEYHSFIHCICALVSHLALFPVLGCLLASCVCWM